MKKISLNKIFKFKNTLGFLRNQSSAKKISADERGATMVEYGVMVALIVVGSMAVVQQIGASTNDGFKDVELALAQSLIQ